ncbi:MAG: hypothetical protein OYL92_08625 [Acidobacteriota bacterium]|nr:hypothetical protein [Acidobacteriota bacterium]MDE2924065.1 hypothetical protein [Acidobacteriota bacterium]MDE3265027.1 hypothetical protein [Acidobacteriota bacterium]
MTRANIPSNIPRQVLAFQRQVLEFQRAAFENGYDAIVALQDRQLELADRMMNQVPNLPEEARDLIQTWRGAAQEGQRQFKNTIDGSFDAVTTYLDRLADGSATDEATDQAPPTPQVQEETAE